MKRYIPYTHLSSWKNLASRKIIRFRVQCTDFTIVGSNCWGSRVYQELRLPYQTPFVGLFLYAPCFLYLLKHIDLLKSDLEFVDHSKYQEGNLSLQNANHRYPVGILGGEVEIHFLHYKDAAEAREKWAVRSARMNMDRLFIAFTDRDLCTPDHLAEFDRLEFLHKVVFTARSYPLINSAIWLPEYAGQPSIGDIFTDYEISTRHFDVANWLNGGTGKPGSTYSIITRSFEVKTNNQ